MSKDNKKTANQSDLAENPVRSKGAEKEAAKDDGTVKVEAFYTKDGTPVEPSSIPIKDEPFKDIDLSARPDVHTRKIDATQVDVRNEDDLKDNK